MFVDLQPSKSWETINEQLRRELKLLDEVQVRLYRGTHQAFYEVASALGRQFTHKTAAAFIDGSGPYFEKMKIETSRDGGQVHVLPVKDLDQAESWSSELGRETLYVAYALDNPVTGEIYNVEPLTKGLGDKKIYRIILSHSFHNFRQPSINVGPYEIRLIHAGQGYTVMLAGKKVQLGKFGSANTFTWDLSEAQTVVCGLEKKKENKDLVTEFESKKWGGAEPLFNGSTERIFDRAAIYWPDMDGEAVIQFLSQKLGFTLNPPGYEDRIETSSLCRWGGLKTMDWLKTHGYEPDTLRGLVLIDTSLLNDDLGAKIESVRDEILAIQKG